MTILKDDALDRWMYKRDGMDYGPFTTREIEHMIEQREISQETEVLNRRTRQWARVQDVPKLKPFIEELSRRAFEAARQAEISADHNAVVRGNWWSTHLPLVAGGALVVGVGVAAFFLLRAPAPVLAGYPTNFYKDLQFERMVPLRAMIVEPAKVTRDPVKAVRTKARSTGPLATAPGSVDMAPQVDLSFGGDEVAGGHELTQGDIDGIQKIIAPRLIRCFRTEAERNPAFTGGAVFVYLMPRGAAQVSRVDTNPAPSAELASCAKQSTAGIKVEPFSGAAQVIQIPLHVAQ
jgi:hypothetical protein